MGFLQSVSTVSSAGRLRAMTSSEYNNAFFNGDYVPPMWPMGSAGEPINQDLALTLSYVYCAVDIISSDFGTMTCQMFKDLGDDNGRARVKFSDPGIGALAYRVRWKPNQWQTAKAFWSTLAWQYLLWPAAYAELIYRPGTDSFVDEIIPRYPGRIREEMLPSGRLRFRIQEPDGSFRYLTQDEMMAVRNTSVLGVNGLGRMDYGASTIRSGLSLQDFTRNFFKKGASASLMATYKGEIEEGDESKLHGSITRYLSGVENAGGLLLVPADVDIKQMGVDPDKAELVGLKNLSGRDVARLFKMPPSWLGIEDSQSYGSQIQDATNYVNRVQIPMAVEFEQAIHRDMIIANTVYFVKFNMDYLLRASTKERMEAHEIAIRSRVYRPSTARLIEDLPPDPALDKLSESDNRPGQAAGASQKPAREKEAALVADRVGHKLHLMLHDNAIRCLRRERAAVEKMAKKHASDVEGWQAGLREFYEDHAAFVAQTMRMPIERARDYAAQHGSVFETQGMRILDGESGTHWERHEAEALSALALEAA